MGNSPLRPDGAGKVSGQALYVDDIQVAGMWFGSTVRCPYPAARILAIDPALEDPDAVVVTARDLEGPNFLALIAEDWPVLADGVANHSFEPVALVAAPTRGRARRAAQRVQVRYEPLDAVLTLDQALAHSGVPNELARCALEHGDLERGFAEAEHVIEGSYETGHQEHVYIEPQGMIAIPKPDGALEIVGSMQCPYYVHKALLRLFEEKGERIRVRQAVTGGGFGGKEDYPDMIAAHAALLARRAGRPVKIVYDRQEDIQATSKRHPAHVRHRTGVTRDGKLTAMDIEVLLDGGAYVTLSPVVLSRAVLHAAGPYACPNVRIRGRVLATNTVPNGAFRGFGAPQVQFACERQMDRVARELCLDPLSIRERNAYRTGDVTPTGQVLSESVSALDCLREAEASTGFRRRWKEIEAARERGLPANGPWPGIGLSLFWHGSGFTGNGERLMRSPVRLGLAAGGRIEIRVSSTDFGQGTNVALAQVVADAVGVPLAQVEVVPPDTAAVPDSGPTVASRTVMIIGGVLARAGRTLRQRVADFAEEQVELAGAGFARVADAYLAANGALEVEERFAPDSSESFDEETYRGTAYPAYGWGADVVELEVDPDTLAVKPEKIAMVCDVGKAIHPVLCQGQVEGGSLQALGMAYLEELRMADGKPLGDRLATYIIPTTLDTPAMETVLLENPSGIGPGGAKGVGELPADGAAPALVQAIENATGIVPRGIPATPERLLDDLCAGRTVAGAPEELALELS